jgi:hypothetical protein
LGHYLHLVLVTRLLLIVILPLQLVKSFRLRLGKSH